LTFNIEVQTDEYIDRPQTPLFWPEKIGVDVYTQIEDGELFNFDEEVEPILNCLISKLLEQSRMEVLEEEEIKDMKIKQRYFEEIRNRELMEVERLEDAEKRRFDENVKLFIFHFLKNFHIFTLNLLNQKVKKAKPTKRKIIIE